MSVYKITLILDDSIPAQSTLLGEIQNTLTSISSDMVNGQPNITVQRLS